MPKFSYRARTNALRVVEGTIEADSEAAALGRLGAEGVAPISITEIGGAAAAGRRVKVRRLPGRVLAYTTHQLADLLGGGLPLLSALNLLASQTEQPDLKRVIESVAHAVRDGRSFSEALAEYPQVYPPLYCSMIRAGEVGGGLEQALRRLAELGEHEADIRSRLINASAYPLFVLAIALLMMVFLIAYVIPKLSLVFIESGQLLPLPTRMLLAVSAAFTRGWWAILLGLGAVGWALRQWHASPHGRAIMDRVVLTVPGIGPLIRKLETARFTRNLGIMTSQGVPVLQALEVVASNVSNGVLRQSIGRIQEAVREGTSIAAALERSRQFPVFVSNMVAVGEESGTVDAALLKVAGTYERDVDRVIRTLTTVLEPLMLVVVGGIVMFLVLAMLLPVFQIGLVVQ